MDVNDWVIAYIAEARENQDEQRFRMGYLAVNAMHAMDHQPIEGLKMLAQARQYAVELNELWWIAFCDHWACQLYLFRLRRSDYALKIALTAVEETSKPEYDEFPQRVCLHEDIAGACFDIDPDGYTDEIEAALGYMREHTPENISCAYSLKMMDMERNILRGALDEARAGGIAALKGAHIESTSGYVSQIYAFLCRISFAREDFAELAHWAKGGALFYGNMGDEKSNIEILMWHAFSMRRAGDEAEAHDIYRTARNAARHGNHLQREGYFDALANYHLAGARPDLALRARNIELTYTFGASYLECQCRLKRLRLLKTLGRSYDDEMSALREAAAGLKEPSKVLALAEGIGA